MEYFKLHDNTTIPALGLGTNTFGRKKNESENSNDHDFKEVKYALENGYRLFDCSICCNNEEGIGRALIESKVDRKDLYIISKISTLKIDRISPERVEAYVDSSIEKLQSKYIDMFFLNYFIDDLASMKVAYQTLIDCKNKGKIKSIGVSNFNEVQLFWLMNEFDEKPVSNQIKINPSLDSVNLIRFCKEHNVLPMAHSPLKNCNDKNRLLLNVIGEKYNKTWSQVLLRFNFQQGICSIPKSHDKKHQFDNINIFDFVINEEDMSIIRKFIYGTKR